MVSVTMAVSYSFLTAATLVDVFFDARAVRLLGVRVCGFILK
jgi:hypothetical protein